MSLEAPPHDHQWGLWNAPFDPAMNVPEGRYRYERECTVLGCELREGTWKVIPLTPQLFTLEPRKKRAQRSRS